MFKVISLFFVLPSVIQIHYTYLRHFLLSEFAFTFSTHLFKPSPSNIFPFPLFSYSINITKSLYSYIDSNSISIPNNILAYFPFCVLFLPKLDAFSFFMLAQKIIKLLKSISNDNDIAAGWGFKTDILSMLCSKEQVSQNMFKRKEWKGSKNIENAAKWFGRRLLSFFVGKTLFLKETSYIIPKNRVSSLNATNALRNI